MSLFGTFMEGVVSMENLTYEGKREIGTRIEAVIVKLLKGDVSQRDARADIEKIIREETRMRINFTWENDANAYLRPHDIDKNHVFWQEKSKLISQLDHHFDFGRIKEGDGWVDLKSGRVGGVLCDVEFTVGCGNPKRLISATKDLKQVAARTTGIILHEVGHAFTTCLYMGYGFFTNLVISELEQRWHGMTEKRRYEAVRELEKNGLKTGNENIAKEKDPSKVTSVLLCAHFTALKNELGVDLYSKRGCEALADQYAIRAGYGAPLALALKEITLSPNPVLIYIARAALVISLGVLSQGFSIATMFAVSLIMEASGASEASEEYDRPERRIAVIENELKRLMGVDLPRDEKIELLLALESIRSEMTDRKEVKTLLMMRIARHLLPTARARHNVFLLQKQLEDLSASELYVSATQLETLV